MATKRKHAQLETPDAAIVTLFQIPADVLRLIMACYLSVLDRRLVRMSCRTLRLLCCGVTSLVPRPMRHHIALYYLIAKEASDSVFRWYWVSCDCWMQHFQVNRWHEQILGIAMANGQLSQAMYAWESMPDEGWDIYSLRGRHLTEVIVRGHFEMMKFLENVGILSEESVQFMIERAILQNRFDVLQWVTSKFQCNQELHYAASMMIGHDRVDMLKWSAACHGLMLSAHLYALALEKKGDCLDWLRTTDCPRPSRQTTLPGFGITATVAPQPACENPDDEADALYWERHYMNAVHSVTLDD